VADAVKVVAEEVEGVAERVEEGDFGVGEVAADEEDEGVQPDAEVGEAGELEAAVGCGEGDEGGDGGGSESYSTTQGADSFMYDRVGRMLTSSRIQGEKGRSRLPRDMMREVWTMSRATRGMAQYDGTDGRWVRQGWLSRGVKRA